MKKNKTKILITLFALLVGGLFLLIQPVSHAQPAQPVVSLGTATGSIGVGSTVLVPLEVQSNPAIGDGGIASLQVEIQYDPNIFTLPGEPSATTVPSFIKTSVLRDLEISLTANRFVDPNDSTKMILRGIVVDLNVDKDTHPQLGIPNGVIAQVSFPVSQNAVASATPYALPLTVSAVNKDSGDITTTANSGSITLQDNHARYGMDNFIQLKNDWLQTNQGSPANVDGNEIVDARDLGIMMHYWQNGS